MEEGGFEPSVPRDRGDDFRYGFGDIIIGVIGGFIGSWLWGVLKLPMIANFWISAIVTATVGAVLLLFIIKLVRR